MLVSTNLKGLHLPFLNSTRTETLRDHKPPPKPTLITQNSYDTLYPTLLNIPLINTCISTVTQITTKVSLLFSCLVFNNTFSTNRLYCAIGVRNISKAGGQHRHIIKQRNNTLNQENHKYSSAWPLWIRSHHHDQAYSQQSF